MNEIKWLGAFGYNVWHPDMKIFKEWIFKNYCLSQVCVHGSLPSTSSPSLWPMVTCWTICANVTERRWMLWCCSTWPLRSPLLWSTWRRRTSSIGTRKEQTTNQKSDPSCLWAVTYFLLPTFRWLSYSVLSFLCLSLFHRLAVSGLWSNPHKAALWPSWFVKSTIQIKLSHIEKTISHPICYSVIVIRYYNVTCL